MLNIYNYTLNIQYLNLNCNPKWYLTDAGGPESSPQDVATPS